MNANAMQTRPFTRLVHALHGRIQSCLQHTFVAINSWGFVRRIRAFVSRTLAMEIDASKRPVQFTLSFYIGPLDYWNSYGMELGFWKYQWTFLWLAKNHNKWRIWLRSECRKMF